jgi:hypothetical protein
MEQRPHLRGGRSEGKVCMLRTEGTHTPPNVVEEKERGEGVSRILLCKAVADLWQNAVTISISQKHFTQSVF